MQIFSNLAWSAYSWGFFYVLFCFLIAKIHCLVRKKFNLEVNIMSLFCKQLKPKLLKRALNKIVLLIGAFTFILLVKFKGTGL